MKPTCSLAAFSERFVWRGSFTERHSRHRHHHHHHPQHHQIAIKCLISLTTSSIKIQGFVPPGSWLCKSIKNLEGHRNGGKIRVGYRQMAFAKPSCPQFLIFHPASPSAGVADSFPTSSSFALCAPYFSFCRFLSVEGKLGRSPGAPTCLSSLPIGARKGTETPEITVGQELAF